jgi:bifunctional non-homologous end joining protein LigD
MEVKLTHVDRVMFPDDGITKGDVIAYYRDVAPVMLPELRRRALTIERFTKSIAEGGFYQKHAQKHYPAWIERVELGEKTRVAYPVCDSADALVYFANQGALAFHVWTSRVDAPEKPDEIVIDLDPPKRRFDLVRRAAHAVRSLLDEKELPSFVKTTGSAGLHVVVPLEPVAFDVASRACEALARELCARHPDLLTTEFYKKDRGERLYLDILRNALGATAIAAYSLRGRARAPVATPIEWSEVDTISGADAFTLRDVRARLDARGDAWRDLRKHPARLQG